MHGSVVERYPVLHWKTGTAKDQPESFSTDDSRITNADMWHMLSNMAVHLPFMAIVCTANALTLF